MRIALIAPGFSHNADDWAIPALQELACQLARAHELEVFSLRYPAAGDYRFCGLRHRATGGGARSGTAAMRVWQQALNAVITRHKRRPFDVIHAFWVDEPAFVAGLAGAVLRLPVVASVGGGELVYFPDIEYGVQRSPVRRLLIRFALRQAARVTVGSNYLRRLCLVANVPAEKLRPAPLGVDTDRFQPGPPVSGPPTIVQAASLTPVKQQSLLLEVLAHVCAELPTARLLLAGEGPLRHTLEAQAEALGLSHAIRWLGKVSYPLMPDVYHRGHVYVQTSRHESQGMAVLEAMACGLPALGTPVGVLPETSAAPPVWEAAQIAEQTIRLLTDPAEYRDQQAAARTLVKERFDVGQAALRFAHLYHTLNQSG